MIWVTDLFWDNILFSLFTMSFLVSLATHLPPPFSELFMFISISPVILDSQVLPCSIPLCQILFYVSSCVAKKACKATRLYVSTALVTLSFTEQLVVIRWMNSTSPVRLTQETVEFFILVKTFPYFLSISWAYFISLCIIKIQPIYILFHSSSRFGSDKS